MRGRPGTGSGMPSRMKEIPGWNVSSEATLTGQRASGCRHPEPRGVPTAVMDRMSRWRTLRVDSRCMTTAHIIGASEPRLARPGAYT